MSNPHRYHRPPFEEALAAWKTFLQQHSFATDLLWILEENLCFEKDPVAAAGVKLGFQTQFTPHPADAAKVTYHHFAESDARVVRGRPLSAVDFCMTMAALSELKAHGRVLTPDERFGLNILRSMQQK